MKFVLFTPLLKYYMFVVVANFSNKIQEIDLIDQIKIDKIPNLLN